MGDEVEIDGVDLDAILSSEPESSLIIILPSIMHVHMHVHKHVHMIFIEIFISHHIPYHGMINCDLRYGV